MNPIIPTIFAHNKSEFQERFSKLVKISKNLQIDFMDSRFVPAKSILPSQLSNLKKHKVNFEAHLMVSNPSTYVTKLKQLGFKKIIFHFQSLDSTEEINSLIKKIKKEGLQPWIALNPNVPTKSIFPFLFDVSGVLFMGVFPGEEKQKFIGSVYKKIKLLKKVNSRMSIQVDGGANKKTIKKLAKLGVNYINSGSYISNAENPKQALAELNNIYKKNKK